LRLSLVAGHDLRPPPPGQTFGNFDWSFQPTNESSRIETLATCARIRAHATVSISGPPGIGKTHMAVALGVKAVENGFSVTFCRLEDLLHALKQETEGPPRRLRYKKYMKVSLLVVDEIGFQPMSRLEASLLFRLVSHRYQRGSTLITTKKAVKDWPEILAGDDVTATALLDRLLHRCHVLDIKGRSFRLRDLERMLK
jgi:DNA replication protein DnaC